MDYYIVKFKEYNSTCEVLDYGVFLQKKEGFEKLNPFSAHSQIVVLITTNGTYAQQISGSGEFAYPILITSKDIFLDLERKIIRIISLNSSKYKFTRKMKNGKYQSIIKFLNAL